jgi:hypothetical protein
MRRIVYARLASGALTTAVMSGTVSGAMLISSEGLLPGCIGRWLGSWAIAFPVGIMVDPRGALAFAAARSQGSHLNGGPEP